MEISTPNHADKKVMDPKNRTWTKKKDALPEWMKEIVKRLVLVEKHTTSDLINNWDDSNN